MEPAKVKKKKATYCVCPLFMHVSNYVFFKKKREARLCSNKKLIEGTENMPISVISWLH